MRTVGLDVGNTKICFCEVRNGAVVARGTVTEFWQLERLLGREQEPARVAFEACRQGWFIHDALREWGHDVLMIDTTRVRQLGIGQHKRKNDRIDAEVIALAAERGSLPLAHVLSPRARELRMKLGVRRALIETRAQYIVSIRALGQANGQHIGGCNPAEFLKKVAKTPLSPAFKKLVDPLLAMISGLNVQIAAAEAQLLELAESDPIINSLASVPGIGPLIAADFVSVIDAPDRFRSAHQVQAYLGLVPSEKTSGKRRLGAITRQGNAYLRSLLLQAAYGVLRIRREDPLKQWAHAVEKRRSRKVAAIALARRLAGVLWAMWRDGTLYDPSQVGTAIARGLRRQAQSTAAAAEAMQLIGKKLARCHGKISRYEKENRVAVA